MFARKLLIISAKISNTQHESFAMKVLLTESKAGMPTFCVPALEGSDCHCDHWHGSEGSEACHGVCTFHDLSGVLRRAWPPVCAGRMTKKITSRIPTRVSAHPDINVDGASDVQ